MATNAQVMDALADQIDAELSAVTDVTIGVHGRAFSAATVPAVDMYPVAPSLLVDQLGGFGELVSSGLPLNIRVRVQPADLYAGEDLLLALTDDEDPLSIIGALDSDHMVNGHADDLKWGDWAGYIDFPDPNGEGRFLGSLLPVVVIKARS